MKSTFVLLLAIFAYSGIYGQVRHSEKEKALPLDPAVRQGILPNGFQYYILKGTKPDTSIHFDFIVKAGYIDEEKGQYGLAHLVEHLGMRNTVNFPNGLHNYFVDQGLKRGRDIGASTNWSTVYSLIIPAHDTMLRTKAFLAVHDWAGGGVLFANNQVDEERSAVIREVSMALTPSFTATNKINFLQSNENPLYEGHQLRDIESVRTAPVNSMVRFYKDWYQPVNQALIITGNVNEDEIESQIKEYFNDLSNKDAKTRNSSSLKGYDVTLSGKNRLIAIELDAESRPVIDVEIFKKKKSIIQSASFPLTKEDFRTQLVYKLSEMMMENRLKLADRKEVFKELFINLDAIIPPAGINAIQAHGNVENIHNVADIKSFIQFVATEMRRIQLFGFSTTEFKLAKNKLLMTLRDPNTSLFTSLSLVAHYVDGSAFISTDDQLGLRTELLSTISLQEINQVLTSWISTKDNIDVVISAPSKYSLNIPAEQEVFSWINEIFRRNLPAYKDIQTARQLPFLVFPKKNNSYTRTEIQELKVTKIVLGNGATVLFRPVAGAEDKVTIRGINTRINKNEWLNKRNSMFDLLSNAKSFLGVGMLSPKEISTWENDLSFGSQLLFVKPVLHKENPEILGQASIGNLEPMLRLIYGYFLESKINIDAFRDLQKLVKENKLLTVRDILEDTIAALINGPSDIIFNSTKAMQPINKASVENLFYKYFSNAGEFTFIITGSFDIEKILPLVVNYLSSLKGNAVAPAAKKIAVQSKRENPIDDKYRDVSLIGDSIGNVKVRVLFPGSLDPTIKSKLLTDITSDIITSILYSRLREKEKGVYSIIASPKVTNDLGKFFWDINFECSPADINRLVLATQDELKQLSKGIINAAVFSNAKEQARVKIVRELNNPYYWSNYLSDQVRKGTLSTEAITRLDVLSSITALDVTNAMHNFVDLEHYMLLKLF